MHYVCNSDLHWVIPSSAKMLYQPWFDYYLYLLAVFAHSSASFLLAVHSIHDQNKYVLLF